jgi:hypothetical protein
MIKNLIHTVRQISDLKSAYVKGFCIANLGNIISAKDKDENGYGTSRRVNKRMQESKYNKPNRGTGGSPKGTPKKAPKN